MTRWRWCKPDTQEPGTTSPDEAVEISRQQRAAARAEGSRLREAAADFRALREQNHFAEAIAHALREGR